MSFFVNASQEEAFRLVMDYFNGRRMKIQISSSPSHIKAEFGSWTSISPSDSKGIVEINVAKRNGGSYVNLNFDFHEQYVVALALTAITALIILIVYRLLEIDLLFTLLLILVAVAILTSFLGYSISATKKGFIEEFNMFVQSLASKKD